MDGEEVKYDTAPGSILDFVQTERMRMVSAVGEEALDTKERATLLRDLGRTAIDQTKNEVSRENNKELAAALANIAADRGKCPFLADSAVVDIPNADIPEAIPVPGETSTEASSMDFKNTYQEPELPPDVTPED